MKLEATFHTFAHYYVNQPLRERFLLEAMKTPKKLDQRVALGSYLGNIYSVPPQAVRYVCFLSEGLSGAILLSMATE